MHLSMTSRRAIAPLELQACCRARGTILSEDDGSVAVAKTSAALSLLYVVAAAATSTNGDVNAHKYHIGQRHSIIEDIYWDARRTAETQRKLHQPSEGPIEDGGLRRLFDLWTPDYNCPFWKERVGDFGEGGKWVCGVRTLFEDRPCVVYSIGSGGDSSFEEGMLRRASCQVHTFDPFIEEGVKQDVRRTPGIQFHDWGTSHETAQTHEGVPLKSIQDTMSELQHAWIDVLKVNLKGKEWDVLQSLLQYSGPGIYATQLLIKLHFPAAASEILIWDTLQALAQDNYRLFSFEPNVQSSGVTDSAEFSFIKVSPDGHVCLPRNGDDEGIGLPYGCLPQSDGQA